MKLRAVMPLAGVLVALTLFSSIVRSGPSGLQVADDAAIADALDKNGPVFVDWKKPKLALLFTGRMNGYLEPCGCAGLDNQKGGLKRRHTLIRELRDKRKWPLLALDAGGMVRRIGPQAEMKYRYGLDALVDIGYAAIGVGGRELLLSADAVLYAIANLDPETNPLISANVGVFGFDNGFTRRYRVLEQGGLRVGVTSVLGSEHQEDLANSAEIEWTDPAAGLRQAASQLKRQRCDYQVLLAHTTREEAVALAKRFPQFDFVVTTGGAEEPANAARPIEGTKSQLIETGHKGMYAIVLGLYGKGQPFEYQKAPLDHRYSDSPEMHQMLIEYQREVETLGLSGLGLLGASGQGMAHPKGEFAGTAACADCHTEAMAVFEGTPHAHATETLVELDPPRHYDPECLSCHVVGWDPQGYFPYDSGYLGLEATPLMLQNGCENCHGPGAAHVAAENGEGDYTDEQIEALRAEMHMELVENEGNNKARGEVLGPSVKNCLECHDIDNSPEFDFQEYWPMIEHTGKY
ncbi:MAG: multiheme c-type cytochrome [Planctomycetota bacterium]